MQDRLLLRRFVEHDSQAAFAEIVGRYLRLVYSTCLREVGDHYLAEDVTQGVFLILAQKAPSLGRHVPLAGWLFRTAQLASKNAIRQAQRRREHTAAEIEKGDVWPAAHRHPQEQGINEALAALKSGEREAVLLRFFEEMPFKEVGETLGLSEDAAQKRVSRALEKMRTHLTRHGEALSLAALIGILIPNASQAVLDRCARPLLQIIPGLKITLDTSSLFGSKAYQISQGAIRTMKVKATMTAASISAVAVASASLLMAGAVRGGSGIVGTWSGRITLPTQEIASETLRFNGDGTFTMKESPTSPQPNESHIVTMAGKYKLTGSALTWTLVRLTDGGKVLAVPSESQVKPAVVTLSKDGKTLTFADGSGKVVLRRQ